MKFLNSILNNNYFIIFIISLILFISKWYPLALDQKNLFIEFIFNYDGDGKSWIPHIKFISEFSLNNSFDPNIDNLKTLPIPIGSLFLYSVFFKIFNLYGLVIIELLIIFLFLLIFFKIFSKVTSRIYSLIYALLLFSFPEIIDFLEINNHHLSHLSANFFSFRPHRPIFSNIFFFFGIYLLLNLIIEEKFDKKNFYIFSIITGLVFSSFYYFSLILVISFLFVITYKFGLIKFIKEEFFTLLKSLGFFILFSLPFIMILITHEKDVSASAGLINLDFNKKKILLKYYFNVFFNYKFIILFTVITFFTFFLKNDQKSDKLILLLFFIFLSSLFSPLIFILISPSSGLIYHFNNNIALVTFLFSSFVFFLKLFNRWKFRQLYLTITLFLVLFFNSSYKINSNINNYKYQSTDKLIGEFLIITEDIKSDFNKKFDRIGILTFESNFMIWGILNDIKYFNILNHLWVPKNYNAMETDLINSFKFLNIQESDFRKFFANDFMKWRYFIPYAGEFFQYRYQANSLTAKKEFMYDDTSMKNFIMSSPPNHNQQIAIHKSELKRLVDKYNSSLNRNFRKPEIIILDNKKDFLQNYVIDENDYCTKFIGSNFTLYYLINSEKCSN